MPRLMQTPGTQSIFLPERHRTQTGPDQGRCSPDVQPGSLCCCTMHNSRVVKACFAAACSVAGPVLAFSTSTVGVKTSESQANASVSSSALASVSSPTKRYFIHNYFLIMGCFVLLLCWHLKKWGRNRVELYSLSLRNMHHSTSAFVVLPIC